MEARPTPAIEYAPPLPRHRRWVRRGFLPLLAAAALVSAYWWGPPFWFRLQLAHAERQCRSYIAAPAAIAYTEDPEDVKRLAAIPAGYRPGPAGEGSMFLVPPAWSKFYGLLSPPGFQSRGTVFLHERRTPAGRRLLVAIDYLGDDFLHAENHWIDVSEFQVRAFELGGPFSLPVEVQSDQVTRELYTPDGRRETLRLYAGQPDPNDPTHFTITWELTDDPPARGVLDGWVREDGVDLEPREAPATPPPPASPG
jgi:hypothetical protein